LPLNISPFFLNSNPEKLSLIFYFLGGATTPSEPRDKSEISNPSSPIPLSAEANQGEDTSHSPAVIGQESLTSAASFPEAVPRGNTRDLPVATLEGQSTTAGSTSTHASPSSAAAETASLPEQLLSGNVGPLRHLSLKFRMFSYFTMYLLPVPILQHIFSIGHKHFEVGSGSSPCIRRRKKYLQNRNTAFFVDFYLVRCKNGRSLKAVLWNRNYLLRFRFRF
jgi:hypothetical protein